MKGASLTLYYKDGKFSFSGWEALRDGDDLKIDIDKVLGEGSKDQKCGVLVEKLFNKAVKSKFRFELDPPKDLSKLVDDKGLHLLVPWSVEISVLGQVVGKVWIMDLPLDFERPFKIDNIWTRLAKEAGKNMVKIGVAIMENPAVFGKLLALAGSEKLAITTLNRIFCRGVDDKDWVEKTRDYTRSKWKEIKQKIKDIWDLIKKIKKLIELGEWIAALAEFIELLSILLPLLLLLVAFLRLIAWLISLLSDDEDKKEMEKIKDEVEEEQTKLSDAREQSKLDIGTYAFGHGDAKAQFAENSDDTVVVKWNKLKVPEEAEDKVDIAFIATFATNDRFENPQVVIVTGEDFANASTRMTNSEYKFAPVVYVRLEATITVKYEHVTDRDDKPVTEVADPQHIEYVMTASHEADPPAPADVEFELTGDDVSQLHVAWKASADFRYELMLHVSSHPNQDLTLYHDYTPKQSTDNRLLVPIDLRSRDPASLSADAAETIRCRLRAMQEPGRFKNSEWIDREVPYQAQRFVNDLRVESAGTYIAVSWAKVECKKYRVRLYDNFQTAVVEKTIVAAEGQPNRLGTRIKIPDNFPDTGHLYTAVQAIDIPDNTCPVWSETTVAVEISSRPPVTILDDESKTTLALSTKELRLAVKMKWQFNPSSHRLAVMAVRPDQETRIPDERVIFKPTQDRLSGLIRITGFDQPYPTLLAVLTEKLAPVAGVTYATVRGPNWTVFTIPTNPVHAVANIECRFRDTQLCVRWEYPQGVNMVRVQATSGKHTDRVSSLRANMTEAKGGEVGIPGFTVNQFEETTFDIEVLSMFGPHVFGEESTISWSAPPPYELWSTSKQAFADQKGASNGTGLVAIPTASTQVPNLFWLEGDDKSLMAVSGKHNHPSTVVASVGHVSCLSVSTPRPGSHQIFYAKQDGMISTVGGVGGVIEPSSDGHINFGNSTDLGFGPVTLGRRPGLIVAISEDNKYNATTHLWWIGPTKERSPAANTIWYAYHYWEHLDGVFR